MHHLHEHAKGSHERELDLLELKLQVAVSQHVAKLPGPQDDQQVLLAPELSLLLLVFKLNFCSGFVFVCLLAYLFPPTLL